MNTSIAEYSPTAAALANLSEKYRGIVFDCTLPTGMREAKQSRAELRGYRVALEKLRVEIKAPALKRAQEIDNEAKRITAELTALEDPIDGQIKQEEQRKENERLAAERAAQEKVIAEYQAFREEEDRKIAAERAEIERQRAELAEQERAMKAKLEAVEAETRRLRQEEENRIRAEHQAIEAERQKLEAQARALREAEEAEGRKLRQEAEDQARALREAEEAEGRKLRIKAEAQARIQREAEEDAERRRLGAIQELMDGKALLTTFLIRFAHRPEFAEICGPIRSFLKQPYA